MNIYALTIGFLTALMTIKLFKHRSVKSTQVLYAWYLASFPLYYFFFAIYGADTIAFIKEILVGFVFFSFAWSSLKLQTRDYPLLLAFGYFLHAFYDFSHSLLFINPGVPNWWPEFCGVIDLILGLYIAKFTFNQRNKAIISPAVIQRLSKH